MYDFSCFSKNPYTRRIILYFLGNGAKYTQHTHIMEKKCFSPIFFEFGTSLESINLKKKALPYRSGILDDVRRISKEKGLAS